MIITRVRYSVAALAIFMLAATSAIGAMAAKRGYVQKNLVSDGAVTATTTDPNLLNPWGITFFPGSPFWISDNNGGVSTLYDGLGNIIPLVVKIPAPPGSTATAGTPTGIVPNLNSNLFVIPGTTDFSVFIFATEDGTIAAWSDVLDVTNAHIVVDNSQGGSSTGAVYKGLAVGNNATGVFLYATNFRSGKVDVFDSNFNPAALSGSFSDPNLPAGFAPFGIANIVGNLFVAYAEQDTAKHDPIHGVGLGVVDIFDTNGNLIKRFATKRKLNAPWGMVQAPYNFGRASAKLLIGNFGDGRINVFDPQTGRPEHQLPDTSGKPITIDGLWALTFGGAQASDPGTLYFDAGPNKEVDGLFGTLSPE
jgi:uncharacterized protein (TIGR03118 family)